MSKIIYKSKRYNARSVLAALMFGVVATGCSTIDNPTGASINSHPIQVAESVERLELYTRPDGLSLTARDQEAVRQFIQEFGRFGHGPLYVNLPVSPSHAGGVRQAQGMIQQSLAIAGLSQAPVQTGQYQVAQNIAAPVIVSYRRLKTLPKKCGLNTNLLATYSNGPYEDFGCAYNANLAALVEDPRQFIEPYSLSAPDARRRREVYDRYIQGENPASAQPERQEVTAEDNGG